MLLGQGVLEYTHGVESKLFCANQYALPRRWPMCVAIPFDSDGRVGAIAQIQNHFEPFVQRHDLARVWFAGEGHCLRAEVFAVQIR